MNITEHFSLREFHCKDGTPYPLEWIKTRLKPLCEALEIIRKVTGKPLVILSGYRTKEWNKKVGGANESYHTKGMAADFTPVGFDIVRLGNIIDTYQKNGVLPRGGLHVDKEKNFIHIDIRGKIARW
jgi:uncharacterized protein YcbK (DUF882 family)